MDIPVDNTTALQYDIYHGWMSSPNRRSTGDVLWTCLATIVLCVYTAVHLNIPQSGERKRRQALRRAKWVVMAILAPEVVLQAAWRQFSDARALRDRLRKYIRQISTPDHEGAAEKSFTTASAAEIQDVPAEADITLTYAFYAVMGGFRLKITSGEYAGKVFTANILAVDELAQAGFFWNIETTAIEDKSKQDSLAKLLTIMQVGWMIVQCCARKASSLPITILEIHTFIHAVCAAVMFGLWFKVITFRSTILGTVILTLLQKPLDVRDATTKAVTQEIRELVDTLLSRSKARSNREASLVLRRVNFGRDRLASMGHFNPWLTIGHFRGSLDPSFETDTDLDFWTSFVRFVAVQTIYGAFHMTAWNSHFPSPVERWLWRSSCVIATSGIALSCTCFSAGFYILDCIEAADKVVQTQSRKNFRAFLSSMWYDFVLVLVQMMLSLLILAIFITLAIARVYIVVEAFVSLRAVPIGVYDSISWSSYIPHI